MNTFIIHNQSLSEHGCMSTNKSTSSSSFSSSLFKLQRRPQQLSSKLPQSQPIYSLLSSSSKPSFFSSSPPKQFSSLPYSSSQTLPSLPLSSLSFTTIPLYRYSKIGDVITRVFAFDYDAGKNGLVVYSIEDCESDDDCPREKDSYRNKNRDSENEDETDKNINGKDNLYDNNTDIDDNSEIRSKDDDRNYDNSRDIDVDWLHIQNYQKSKNEKLNLFNEEKNLEIHSYGFGSNRFSTNENKSFENYGNTRQTQKKTKFKIDANSGVLSCNNDDYYKKTKFRLTIIAQDMGKRSKKNTLMINLKVTDDYATVKEYLILNERSIAFIENMKKMYLSSIITDGEINGEDYIHQGIGLFKFKESIRNSKKMYISKSRNMPHKAMNNIHGINNNRSTYSNYKSVDELIRNFRGRLSSYTFKNVPIYFVIMLFCCVVSLLFLFVCVFLCAFRYKEKKKIEKESSDQQLEKKKEKIVGKSVGKMKEYEIHDNVKLYPNGLEKSFEKYNGFVDSTKLMINQIENTFSDNNFKKSKNFVDSNLERSLKYPLYTMPNIKTFQTKNISPQNEDENTIKYNHFFNNQFELHKNINNNDNKNNKNCFKTCHNYSPFYRRCASQNNNAYTLNKNNQHNNFIQNNHTKHKINQNHTIANNSLSNRNNKTKFLKTNMCHSDRKPVTIQDFTSSFKTINKNDYHFNNIDQRHPNNKTMNDNTKVRNNYTYNKISFDNTFKNVINPLNSHQNLSSCEEKNSCEKNIINNNVNLNYNPTYGVIDPTLLSFSLECSKNCDASRVNEVCVLNTNATYNKINSNERRHCEFNQANESDRVEIENIHKNNNLDFITFTNPSKNEKGSDENQEKQSAFKMYSSTFPYTTSFRVHKNSNNERNNNEIN